MFSLSAHATQRFFFVLFINLFWSVVGFTNCIQPEQEQAEITKIIEARKNAGLTTEPFMRISYPALSFQEASLPIVRLGPEFLEILGEAKADGKNVYQSICSGYEENTCVSWCFVRTDSPQFYSAQSYKRVSERCDKCDDSKDKACEDVQYLKKSSDSLVVNTHDKKHVVLQMSVGGELLVFQTVVGAGGSGGGKKDLSQPYLKVTHSHSGKTAYQKIEVMGTKADTSAVTSYLKVDSQYGYYGFKICDQASVSTKSCDVKVAGGKETGLGFACKGSGASGTPSSGGTSGGIEVRKKN